MSSYPPARLDPRTDSSPGSPGAHAADHTAERAGINSIVGVLGPEPAGVKATVQARFEAVEDAVAGIPAPVDELPEVTVADDGKVLGVTAGVWGTAELPEPVVELPVVSGADDGKVLTVVAGVWADAPVADSVSGSTLDEVTLTNPTLTGYVEACSTNAAATGAVTLSASTANVFKLSLTGNVTVTLSAPATAGVAVTLTAVIVQGSPVRSVTWPASVKWAAGAPTLKSGTSIVTLMTVDAGTTWFGVVAVSEVA